MDLSDAVEFARTTRESVLATLRANGRPQLSNVWHQVDEGGIIRVSTKSARAKARNLGHRPWAALHVTRTDFLAYAVIECGVELSSVAAEPDDATVDELVAHYRRIVGEHRDWDRFRQTQVDEGRVMVRLTPARAYGMVPGS